MASGPLHRKSDVGVSIGASDHAPTYNPPVLIRLILLLAHFSCCLSGPSLVKQLNILQTSFGVGITVGMAT